MSVETTQYPKTSCHYGKNGGQNFHSSRNSGFLAVLSQRILVIQFKQKYTVSQMQATMASVKSHICAQSTTKAMSTSAKSRVAPLKPMSIPRLELTARVISVNVASMLKSELDIEHIKCYYYTNSEILIGYINNEARCFHLYVGNRVQHIRDHSSPGDWFHVPGKENPADEASRGLTAKELLENDLWFTGPKFLWQQDLSLQQSQPVYTLLPSDIEVRKDSASTLTSKISEVKI